jgi:hypothetical protein
MISENVDTHWDCVLFVKVPLSIFIETSDHKSFYSDCLTNGTFFLDFELWSLITVSMK